MSREAAAEPGGDWCRIAAHGNAPAEARRHVAEWMTAHGATPDALHDLVLAASELTSNVVQHGGMPWVYLRLDDDHPECWTLEVVGGPRQPPALLRNPSRWSVSDPDSTNGRGLGIVRTVVDEVVVSDRFDLLAIRCRRRRHQFTSPR